MPNWCHNNLTITPVTPEQHEVLKEAMVKGEFLETFMPSPAWAETPNEQGELPTVDPETGGYVWADGTSDTRWYNWNNENWGTKWDITEPSVESEEGDGSFGATFQTAWAPASEQFLAHLSTQFPGATVNLTYCELGEGFYGATVARDGVALDEACGTEVLSEEVATHLFPDYDPSSTDLYDFLDGDDEGTRRDEFDEARDEAIDDATGALLLDLTAQINKGQDQ